MTKQEKIKIYKRRQRILLICVGSGLLIFIIVIISILVTRDREPIANSNDSFAAYKTAATEDNIPADAMTDRSEESIFRFSESEINWSVGKKDNISRMVENTTIFPEDYEWESSNPSVAIIEDGILEGISAGSCNITVKIINTDYEAYLKVYVSSPDSSDDDSSEDSDNDEESSDDSSDSNGDEDNYSDNGSYPAPEVMDMSGLAYFTDPSSGIKVLIANKSYTLPSNYAPGASSLALNAFSDMAADAADEGLNIHISSGYRSYSDQEAIYNRYVASDGAALADTYSSRAGHSDHQTGLAFDLNSIDDSFGYTPESDWVAAHAHEYGFIIRFPKGKDEYTGYQYEPWHIRYVGSTVATNVYKSGLSLEEYFDIPSSYSDPRN